MEKLWTPAYTAAFIGVEEQTLRVWRSTRRYPLCWVKVGAKVMYRPEDVMRFVEERTNGV